MSIEARRLLCAFMALALVSITCTVQASASEVEPTLSSDQIADTAVARALTAQAGAATETSTPEASATPTSTSTPILAQCSPTILANTDANVRSGPDTAYGIVGYLPKGGTLPVAGRNDANSWWYVQFAGGPGGYAWISGSVVTASCIPTVVQIVAAPPLPTAAPPSVATATLVFSLAPFFPPVEFHLIPSPTPVLSLPPFEFELPELPWP
jgi:uncharacterized protein YraI